MVTMPQQVMFDPASVIQQMNPQQMFCKFQSSPYFRKLSTASMFPQIFDGTAREKNFLCSFYEFLKNLGAQIFDIFSSMPFLIDANQSSDN